LRLETATHICALHVGTHANINVRRYFWTLKCSHSIHLLTIDEKLANMWYTEAEKSFLVEAPDMTHQADFFMRSHEENIRI